MKPIIITPQGRAVLCDSTEEARRMLDRARRAAGVGVTLPAPIPPAHVAQWAMERSTEQ